MSKQSKARGINHILSVGRRKNSLHPELANPYYDKDNNGNDVQVFLDGYRMAVLRDFVDVTQFLGIKKSTKAFPNWKKFIDIEEMRQNGIPTELPNLKQLKEWVKSMDKMNTVMPYDFGENFACVNCYFLVDAMEIVDLKTAKAYSYGYKNLCLCIIDDRGNYVYTLGINKRTERKLTDLTIKGLLMEV